MECADLSALCASGDEYTRKGYAVVVPVKGTPPDARPAGGLGAVRG